jgi:hypothetical protein
MFPTTLLPADVGALEITNSNTLEQTKLCNLYNNLATVNDCLLVVFLRHVA